MHQYSSKGRKPSLVPDVHVGSYDVTIEDRVDKSLLTEVERQQLAAWNATQQEYSQDLCIPQWVERQTSATPEAPALFMGDQFLSYKQLNEQANRLAHHLQACGVRSNVLVGICIERSLDMVVGLLAILKAGGAYVPLDPSYPAERLTLMLQDAQVPVLVSKRQTAPCLSIQHASIVCIDDAEALAPMSTDDPAPIARADDIAYVVYTSGSTSRPKGVQITHRSLLNLVFWHQRTFEVKASDRTTQFASPSFDVAGEELWSHLTIGASVYLIDEAIRFDSTAIRDWLVNHGITIAILPTALVESLMSLAWPPTTALRVMLTGGDALYRYPPPTLPFAVINNYGPTEATVVATYGCVFPLHSPGLNSVEANLGDASREGQDGHSTAPPSIGRPIANAQVYILDERLQQVPIEVPGELHIGGAGLARGYLNRPELTAERFIPDPFSQAPGARLYKTGDVACYLPDGNIEFLGRSDSQVKIRGFRIELGEIEAVLRQHAEVREAVVVVREDAPGEKRLVGYVILEEKGAVTGAELQKHVMKQLPNYMALAAVVVLEAFPYTPNGKVDRRGLSASHLSTLTQEETLVAPRLLIHHQLVQIWEELLEMRPIGIRDNFFYIGGHSLLAVRLVDRIEHVFGRRVALSTLFSGPTIEELQQALQRQANAGARTTLLPVQVGGSKRPFFFLHGDWTGGAFYCFAVARVLGPDQPFYALEPYKFGGLQTLPSLETVVAAHIESMRAIQPEGPYLLGGFCNGGLLAYEMARQLQAAGERVDLLALINPSPPVQLKSLRTVSNCIGKLLRLGADKQANLFLRVRHALRHVYRYLFPSSSRVQDFDQLLVIDPRLKAMFPPVEAYPNDYVGVFTWLVSRYETGIYAGKITFYWAREEPLIEKSWHAVTGAKDREDVENHVVAGTHMSCVTEHIQDLAGRLSTCVSRAQEEAVTPKNMIVKCS